MLAGDRRGGRTTVLSSTCVCCQESHPLPTFSPYGIPQTIERPLTPGTGISCAARPGTTVGICSPAHGSFLPEPLSRLPKRLYHKPFSLLAHVQHCGLAAAAGRISAAPDLSAGLIGVVCAHIQY